MLDEKTYISNKEYPVSGFLQFYDREKTVDNYRSSIQNYLLLMMNHDLAYDLESLDRVALAYLNELRQGRNVVNDLMCASSVYLKRYATSTVRLRLSSVCLWLEDCGISLSHRERQRIFMRIPSIYPVRIEAELTRMMFQKIYKRMQSEWVRVLLRVMLASGMRIGEALALHEDDILWNDTRVSILLPAHVTKTRVSRIVYLTEETADALKAYLASSTRKRKDNLVFPYSCTAAERCMRDAVDTSGYGKNGSQPRLVHWHMTRKWFISRFSLYASKEVAEELAGHVGYLSRSYQRFTRRQILTQYRKAANYLELFPKIPEVSRNSLPKHKNDLLKHL